MSDSTPTTDPASAVTPTTTFQVLQQLASSKDDASFPQRAREILKVGKAHFGFPIGAISYADNDKLRVLHASSPENALPEGIAFDVCDTFCQETMRSGKTHAVAAAGEFPQWIDHAARVELGIESYLGTPIRLQGDIWGTLCFFGDTAKDKPFTDTDQQLLELMAAQIQNSYEHALVREHFKAALVGTTELTKSHLLNSMVEQLATGLNADLVWISQCLDEDNSHVRKLAVWEEQEKGDAFNYKTIGTPCKFVIENGFTHWNGNLQDHFPDDEDNYQSYAGTPIRNSDGRVIGLLSVAHSGPLEISEYTRWLMEIYAARAAGELELLDQDEFNESSLAEIAMTDKLSSLGLMAGGVAHDLNNLFTGIIGNIMMIRDQSVGRDSDIHRWSQNLLKSAERAASISRSMLTYLSSSSDTVSAVDLNELLGDLPAVLTSALPNNVEIHRNLSADLPTIMADKGQMQQIVINLLINAAESMNGAAGNVTLASSSRTIDNTELSTFDIGTDLPSGNYVVLEIQDDGVGFDE
ncbi:MAG: GAF domain-containing protein, partial [Pseudomonadota bacterium]